MPSSNRYETAIAFLEALGGLDLALVPEAVRAGVQAAQAVWLKMPAADRELFIADVDYEFLVEQGYQQASGPRPSEVAARMKALQG